MFSDITFGKVAYKRYFCTRASTRNQSTAWAFGAHQSGYHTDALLWCPAFWVPALIPPAPMASAAFLTAPDTPLWASSPSMAPRHKETPPSATLHGATTDLWRSSNSHNPVGWGTAGCPPKVSGRVPACPTNIRRASPAPPETHPSRHGHMRQMRATSTTTQRPTPGVNTNKK